MVNLVKSVFVVIVLLIISSIVLFAPSVHSHANQTQDKSSISPHRNDFSNVRYSSLDAKSSSHPIVNGVELAPFSKVTLSGQSNNTTNITYYSVTISFISMPFSFYNGSWILQFIFDGQPYYFIVGYFDYKYASFVFAGLTNGTYFLTIEPIPYPYYEVSYPSVIVINGSNVSVDVTFPAVHFEFEIYITGIPSIDGMGVWTDYIGMNPENLTFPPFIDLTSEFFAKSTAQNFYPNAFGLPGSPGLNEQAMIEGEMLFFGVINSTYFQYNVSLILTNGTLISGNDSAILFNVTFVNSVPDTSDYENFNGLYLPPDAVFNNVSMSFMNAPGNVSWNGVVANYGGISYGNYGNDQFSLSEHNVIGTVGALNSLISSLNNTGFSTFAFGWCNLYSSSFLVVPAFVPEYGTEIVPGFLEYSGLFSGSGYNFPVGNVNGNISQIIKSPVIINSSNLYSFYSTYYPSYAYYDYYPYLADAVNVTESSIIEPVYLSSAMMNFIPIKEEGMAVGGWGWNMRWAYPVFYPSASYYPSKIANLPKWMGIPYVFSDLNSPFSTAYLLGNYKNLSFTFNLYFFNGTTLSPPFGGGASNVSDLVNGSLPDSNISYWLNLLESYYGQDKALYPYYWEGWMPFVVINISIPYHLIPVIFYSGAEAVVSQVFAPYKVESYAYYNNGSLFQNISGWRYANSSYVVRLLTFKAPSSVSYMYGVMRDDYVISFENLSSNSITPFAVNYSNLPNGTYGSYAGFPSEFVASYVNYAPSLPAEVGESGSVNYMSFGSFKYILSYALYPYPVPMVYAVQDSGNGTFSSSNPFNYFTFHSFGNKTVFDVSTVNANFTWLFNWSAAIGSTDYLSYMTLTSAVPLNVAYVGSPPGLATLQSYNGSS
ncbi:MAG: hypothetical protein QXU98_06925, partial [Candidatus Parvarchaeota archaeon]